MQSDCWQSKIQEFIFLNYIFYSWSDELMDEKAEDVERKLAVFLGRGVLSGTQIRKLVEKCPAILFAESAQKMDECWEQLGVFFSTASVNIGFRLQLFLGYLKNIPY
jgi:hypothetical protein